MDKSFPTDDSQNSDSGAAARGESNPWNLQGVVATMLKESPSLKVLLTDIMNYCHADCSDNVEAANAVTKRLLVLLQQLVALIEGQLQTNPSCELRTCSDSWYLLGMLVENINCHFKFRPSVVFACAGASLESAAAAVRGIKQCFIQFIELLSIDENREENVEAFTIHLMDTEQDAEVAMRFSFLDMISRRVIAVKRLGQIWDAVIDGAPVRFDGEDCSLSGMNASIAPVLLHASAAVISAASGNMEEYNDAKCAICMSVVYENRSDGSTTIDAREMKCPGRHTYHSNCARRWFVDEKRNSCPFCRHDFSSLFCEDIATSLEHRVEHNVTGVTVLWSKPVNQRLAAFNMMALIPRETPLGGSVASAIWLSCFDNDASIAAAALQSRHLCSAAEGRSQEDILFVFSKLGKALSAAVIGEACQPVAGTDALIHLFLTQMLYFVQHPEDLGAQVELLEILSRSLVAALKGAVADEMRLFITHHIYRIVIHNDQARAMFVAAGSCSTLVEALKATEWDEARGRIAAAFLMLADGEEEHAVFLSAGGYSALVQALKISSRRARYMTAKAILRFSKNTEGRANFVAAGCCGVLVEVLENAECDVTRGIIAGAIEQLAQCDEGLAVLMEVGGCGALVQALKMAEKDDSRGKIASSMNCMAKSDQGRLKFVAAGGCGALLETLEMSQESKARAKIAGAIKQLLDSRNEECVASFVAAGGCLALFKALKNADDRMLRFRFAICICRLSKCKQGCEDLAAARCAAARKSLTEEECCSSVVGVCTLISLLEISRQENIGSKRNKNLNSSTWATICELAQHKHVLVCLLETRCSDVLVDVLKIAEDDVTEKIIARTLYQDDVTKGIIAGAMEQLARCDGGIAKLSAAGIFPRLPTALKMSQDKSTKDIIISVIDHFTRRIVPFCDKLTRLYA
jgi:hypothetical protein